jgi:hypothetical protein
MERWVLGVGMVLAAGGCVAPEAGSWVDSSEDGRAPADEAYAIVPGGGDAVFEAINAVHGFKAAFDADGVAVTPEAEDWWELSLKFVRVGHGDALRPVSSGALVAEANRLEHRRGLVTEWYVNDSAGLEQGFTFARRPSTEAGPLTVELSVSGNLTPTLWADDAVLFYGPDPYPVARYQKLVAWDTNGTTLDAHMELRQGDVIALVVDDAEASYPVTIDPVVVLNEDWSRGASDGMPGDEFGVSVAVSGDYAVVGAWDHVHPLIDKALVPNDKPGTAYILKYVPEAMSWTEDRELYGYSNNGDAFGASVGIDGSYLVVGAPGDEVDYGTGNVAVWVKSGSARVFQTFAGPAGPPLLLPGDPVVDGMFGQAVAISGDVVAVGAPGEGAVYVFWNNDGGWEQGDKLLPSDTTILNFGAAVAMANNGKDIVVGAYGDGGDAAFVFQENSAIPNTWDEVKILTSSDPGNDDEFGCSVAVEGDFIMVGAQAHEHDGIASGAAYVFGRDQDGVGNWGEMGELLPSDPEGLFGASVSMGGKNFIVGAPGFGATYAFFRNYPEAGDIGPYVKFVGSDTETTDAFGHSVAATSSIILVGAPDYDTTTDDGTAVDDAGLVYAFPGDLVPPDTMPDAYTIGEEFTLIVSPPGVLENDTDRLTAELYTSPPNGTVSLDADGSFIYTPSPNFSGVDTFTYVALGQIYSRPETVTITVNPLPDPPMAVDDEASTEEDVAEVINVVANDIDPDGNGDALTVQSTTAPLNGSVVISADGKEVTYTPDDDFNGIDIFTYVVANPSGAQDTAMVTVTVTPENDAPEPNDDAAWTDEGRAVIIYVLANDVDVDGDPLTVEIVPDPTSGTAVANDDGTVTYTPDGDNPPASATFDYTVYDGTATPVVATVTVTIEAVNDFPVAADDTVSTNEDTPLTDIDVITDSDTDADEDTLTVVLVTDAVHGTTVLNADGTVKYTPNSNFFGIDWFLYQVSDGNGGTDIATVVVTVNEINDAPVPAADFAWTLEDHFVVVPVLANDVDVDLDALTVNISTLPPATEGTAVVNTEDMTVTFTPVDNFSGTSTFAYTLYDGEYTSAPVIVTIVVEPVNDAPVVVDYTRSIEEDSFLELEPITDAIDPEGDTLTVLVGVPHDGTAVIGDGGKVTYTPDLDFNGVDWFLYQVIDGQGGSAFAMVEVTVTPKNDEPVPAVDYAWTLEDHLVVVDVLANDVDVDLDPLTVNISTPPPAAEGTAVVNTADMTVTFTPVDNVSGTFTFAYTLYDGEYTSAPVIVTIVVEPVNDPPVAGNDTPVTTEDNSVEVDVLSNDIDPEVVAGLDTLTVEIVSVPHDGTAVVETNNKVTYTPDLNFFGIDSFVYRVSDGQGASDIAIVNVTVSPARARPPGRSPSSQWRATAPRR